MTATTRADVADAVVLSAEWPQQCTEPEVVLGLCLDAQTEGEIDMRQRAADAMTPKDPTGVQGLSATIMALPTRGALISPTPEPKQAV